MRDTEQGIKILITPRPHEATKLCIFIAFPATFQA